jgi:hypothetical protein
VKPGAGLALAVALVLALAVGGCGAGSSLSTAQLRGRATQTCNLARRRTNRIATPALPSDGARFLSRGIAALTPELATLKLLRPPTGMASDYTRALAASNGELRALRSALKGLKAGNDPVVAIKTLQQQLVPLEAQADLAWQSLDLPACASD